jgi:Protein of unknown function (DUF3592)
MDFSSLTNNLGGMISGLVALPFIIIAIVFIFLWLRGRRQVSSALNWPAVSGKVVFATVETRHSHSSSGGTSTAYYPNVTYEYTINGQRYQSSQISFGSQVGLGNYNAVLKKVVGYPINSMVQVYYNPDNPAQAVLEKSAPASKIFLFVAVLIVAILACTLTFTLGGMSFISNLVSSVVPQIPK